MAPQARSEATRQKILDAAIDLFSEVGYAAPRLGNATAHGEDRAAGPAQRGNRAATRPGNLRALRTADDGALPHPPRRRSPRLSMHEPLHPRRWATLPECARRHRRRRRRQPAARYSHPARARGRPDRAGRARHPRRRSRCACVANTSTAPATAPIWPVAATSPSTPTTGW